MANNGTKDSDYVVGLDIGTSKVVCIIGKYVDQHSIEVISMGSYPSSGLKKGVVVNIDATTDAIQKSIDQAQASFEGKIKNVSRSKCVFWRFWKFGKITFFKNLANRI